MCKFLYTVLSILFLLTPLIYNQTVRFGDFEISIGDSLSDVISKIDTNNYSFTLSKPEKKGISLSQNIYLAEDFHTFHDTMPIGIIYLSSIESVSFDSVFSPPKYSFSQPTVYCIQKIWIPVNFSNNTNVLDVMNKFYELLDEYGIDKYQKNFNYTKDVEPDGTAYTIDIETNSWHTIEFSFGGNVFQLSEIFTNNEHEFDNAIYYLFFNDYEHYFTKGNNIIIKKFNDEKVAEKEERELEIPYLQHDKDIQEKIFRFWKNEFSNK